LISNTRFGGFLLTAGYRSDNLQQLTNAIHKDVDMYKNTEEAIGALFLSSYWGAFKSYDVEMFATVMFLYELTPEQAFAKFKPDWERDE
jgi:hypothetical protein